VAVALGGQRSSFDNVLPRRERRRRRAIAAYYVELGTDVVELSAVLLWYFVELVAGNSKMTGSLFFSVFARHAHNKLRARLRFHSKWLASRRAERLNQGSGLRFATPDELRAYDDICVVCHDVLHQLDRDDDNPGTTEASVDGAPPQTESHSSSCEQEANVDDTQNGDQDQDGDDPRLARRRRLLAARKQERERRRTLRGQQAVKLPRCGHLFHLSCLHLYLDPTKQSSRATTSAPACPVCRQPISRASDDAPAGAPDSPAQPAADHPVPVPQPAPPDQGTAAPA